MFKSFILTFLLLSMAGCMSKDTSTTNGAINTAAPYVWGDATFPKELKVSTSFDSGEVTNIQDMATAWKTALSDKKTFFSFNGTTSEATDTMNSLDSLRDDVMAIYKVNRWPSSLDSGALAITQIFGVRQNIGKSSEYVSIIHADILINYDIFNFDTADSGEGYDLRTVLLHEMGHFLGLQHRTQDPDTTVMYKSIGRSTAKRAPRSIDISDLASKYNISLGVAPASAQTLKVFAPEPDSASETVRILMELRADGECLHKIENTIIHRHKLKL